ncbi:tRNA 2-selenouridine(34) synthase MnmH [Anaerotalea alkaliphila]|uniref:tRNA 2-selenouridine(34) synthase MnmH n=1 Tax=Anaerotalea alkaliphila TaxID=2662126 RepID=A0A7X5HWT0_9FIRM|nr:tRNA 2-selenouridine(34) synthase MnmH [Anaerotalea alkaliphila]NDL68033.1 tRNA 2-selenouridine(34) synthase MnmH [Anaerotalea alkaliphila]
METTNDFHSIVVHNTPLMDVRAPVEFEKGAFPGAVNLPLMTDEERHLVGICYKEKGSEEAVKLGHQLVQGEVRESRVRAWTKQLELHPDSLLYCFRGGLRSQISQGWIKEATGREIPRLEGGYKAFRNYLMEELAPERQTAVPVILGGCTGSGKTVLLNRYAWSVDLEGLARHRGSAFGKRIQPQPSTIDFENALAYALIRHRHQGHAHLLLEDEGQHIGRCYLPKPLYEHFLTGNLVVLDVPLEKRVENILGEYVVLSQEEHILQQGQESGMALWRGYIESSIDRARKRLGGDRHKRIKEAFLSACALQDTTGSSAGHSRWIRILLEEYYDPMYNYQLENTRRKVVFRGGWGEVQAYLDGFGK